MFKQEAKPTVKSNIGSDGAENTAMNDAVGLSDDDFEVLKAAKPAVKAESSMSGSRSTSEAPAPVNARSKRAAAAAPKKWVIDDDESESEDGGFLGDVGAMVKGIGGGEKSDSAAPTSGRLSLFSMARPGSSNGRPAADLPKLKAKPSRTFNLSDDEDETNYEMLAKSSPQKPTQARDNLDSFLSDDEDDIVPLTKKAPTKAPATKAAPKPVAKVVPKQKKAPAPKKAAEPEKPKPLALSPAAKAYAAKQTKMKLAKNAFSEDEDEEVEMDDDDEEEEEAPKPAVRARGRPARAAAVAKPKPIYVDSDEDMDDDDVDESAAVEDEPSEDDFDESE